MQRMHQYFWGVIHRFSLVCVLCVKMLQNLVSPFGIKNLTLLEKCPLNATNSYRPTTPGPLQRQDGILFHDTDISGLSSPDDLGTTCRTKA